MGKLLKRNSLGNLKDAVSTKDEWFHNLYKKLPYLQPSSLYLIEKESHEYRSHETI